MRKSLVFCALLVGCDAPITPASKWSDSGLSDDEEAEWSAGTTPSDEGTAEDGSGGDDGTSPSENPTLSYTSAVCLEGTVAFWQLALVANDPQGIDTLSGSATCEIFPVGVNDGDPTHTLTLECDGAGRCGQNYDGEDESVLCEAASSWDFHFMITDEDGYVSTVEVVTGVVE